MKKAMELKLNVVFYICRNVTVVAVYEHITVVSDTAYY